MYRRITYLAVLIASICLGQLPNYNEIPTKMPTHVLDEKLTNISFAFSMRVLYSDYNGAMIQLRRESDNALQDFGWSDNDIVDIAAINAWRGTSNVFVRTWYDQSGLDRDALQTANARQPRFYPDAAHPYFRCDGLNDYLIVDTPNGIQDVTNNGDEGTVLTVLQATRKTQNAFGVLVGNNRWSVHANWSNGRMYFDPGSCCNFPRDFNNIGNENSWEHYTFVKTTTNAIIRSGGVQRLNANFSGPKCTRTEDFAIGWASGNSASEYSTNSYSELIMYDMDINATEFQEIEQETITFWGL